MVDSLQEYYAGHCPLSQVYSIYMTFHELALLPSSDDWLSLYSKDYLSLFLNYDILNCSSWDQTQDLVGRFFRPPRNML
jgi:hypothetical protein